MKRDEEAQVHILEMLTLFWLFFMSATFLIRVHVPDAPSVAHDASLEIAGDDAIRYALGLDAVLEGDSRLEEVLNTVTVRCFAKGTTPIPSLIVL